LTTVDGTDNAILAAIACTQQPACHLVDAVAKTTQTVSMEVSAMPTLAFATLLVDNPITFK